MGGAWVKFEERKHVVLVLTVSFPGSPKECHQLLHQLGGVIRVLLDSYMLNKSRIDRIYVDYLNFVDIGGVLNFI